MTKEIVVAYYKENIEWLENVKDYKITIYNKSYIDIPNTIKLENVGREMNTYFHHIIENYDNLSDVIFFTQGNPLDHVSNYIDILNGYPQTLINSELSIGNAHFFSDKPTYKCDMYGSDIYGNSYHWGLDMNVIWNTIFTSPAPKNVEFTGGCIFCVTKEQIKIRDLSFYQKCFGLSKNRDTSPWEFERLMSFLFNENII
jgi:hypothetical protein